MDTETLIKNYHARIWDERDTSAVFDYFAEGARVHSPLKTNANPSALKEILDSWLTGFSDLNVHWDMLTIEGNKVVTMWHCTGTHTGTFLDIPPTQNEIHYKGVTVYECEDNKIKEYWAIVDIEDIKAQCLK